MDSINFTRGDTFSFKFKVKDKQNNYLLKTDLSSLLVTCRKNPDRNYPILFQKTIEDIEQDQDNYFHVILNPEDTETLNYPSDCYYIDIEATTRNGFRKTRIYELNLDKETSIHGGDENGN